MTSMQDDLREIADVLETDSHYSGSNESKRRAGYAAKLREHAAAMDAARPVAGAVYDPEGIARGRVALVEDGTEDWHCRERGARRLYTRPAPPASEVQDAGDWQQYAKDGESAQDVIERERKDSAAFVQLYLSDERNRRKDKLLYGFMLDCDAVGLKGAAENLHRGIKEHLANLTGANNGSGEQGGGNG